jgi:nucleoside-diphosphate-sugar epimerase
MKKVLIIGNQGYLGSRLSDYLTQLGYNVTGSDVGFFKEGKMYKPKEVKMLNKEARNIEESDIVGHDVLILLAGISNDPFGNLTTELIYDPTRQYAKRIALICKKNKIKFIFPSSCSVYGLGADYALDETGPTTPQTPYSLNKLQIEEDLKLISDKSFSPIALRLATVYGMSPRIRFDLVINMLCGMAITEKKIKLNSNGLAWRPHLYIDDVCEAFKCCIEWDYNGGELMILNVGHEMNNKRIIDVAEIISKLTNIQVEFLNSNNEETDLFKDSKINNGVDNRNYQVNFDKIENTLPGFKIKWSVEKGIEQLTKDLIHYQISSGIFKKRDFYRLQQLAYLFANKHIDSNLNWIIK